MTKKFGPPKGLMEQDPDLDFLTLSKRRVVEILQEHLDRRFPGLGEVQDIDYTGATLIVTMGPSHVEAPRHEPIRRRAPEIIESPLLNSVPDDSEVVASPSGRRLSVTRTAPK